MTQSLLTAHYEEFHRERAKSPDAVSVPIRVEFLRRHIGTGKRVVEFGCRYGALLATFCDGNEVVGIDIDAHALEICTSVHGVETHLVNLNDRVPLPDGSFDVVVISEVLEHLPYPDITLAEAARVLRPGGLIVGSVPNATRLRNRLRFLLTGIVEMDRTHLQHFSPKSLRHVLERWFTKVEVELVGGHLARLNRGAFANYMLFSGRRPDEES